MIDTKLLRQKILDLAIRGKLVPQDPKDEPASELLKKIKAEKEALIKAGKVKRDKHESFIFRGDDKRYYEQVDGKTTDITGEVPFEIPDGWAWCRLNVLATSVLGKMLDAHKNRGIPMPYLRNVNVRWGSFDLSDLLKMRFELSENERYGLVAGDLVVCEGGEPGRCAVWLEEHHDMKIQKALHRIRPHKKVSSHFLFYVFRQYAMSHYMDTFFTGSTIKHLTGEAVSHLLVPLPPWHEQQRIVAQIEGLLKCVDEIDRESATLEKSLVLAKQKILDLAIRGKLVPQAPKDEPASELLKKIKAEKKPLVKSGKIKKDKHESFIFRGDDNCYHENIDGKIADITKEIPFDLPDGWAWCRLECITYNIRTKGKQIKAGDMLSTGMFPVVSQGQEDIDGFCNSRDKLIVDIPVVLFGDHTKKVKYIEFPFVVGADGTKIFKPLSDAKWLFYWTSFAAAAIGDRGYGRHWNLLQAQIIPLPPLAEQKRIVSQIEKLFSLLETMRV